jgi:hypothetical protein
MHLEVIQASSFLAPFRFSFRCGSDPDRFSDFLFSQLRRVPHELVHIERQNRPRPTMAGFSHRRSLGLLGLSKLCPHIRAPTRSTVPDRHRTLPIRSLGSSPGPQVAQRRCHDRHEMAGTVIKAATSIHDNTPIYTPHAVDKLHLPHLHPYWILHEFLLSLQQPCQNGKMWPGAQRELTSTKLLLKERRFSEAECEIFGLPGKFWLHRKGGADDPWKVENGTQ